jgi:hypothetical protein
VIGVVLVTNGEVLGTNGDILVVNGELLGKNAAVLGKNGEVFERNGEVLGGIEMSQGPMSEVPLILEHVCSDFVATPDGERTEWPNCRAGASNRAAKDFGPIVSRLPTSFELSNPAVRTFHVPR